MIKHFSKKRAKQNRQYLRLRKLFLKKRSECEAGLKGCSSIATQIHHQKGRIGEMLLNEDYWLPCCGNCHFIIHNIPLIALEEKLSFLRLAK